MIMDLVGVGAGLFGGRGIENGTVDVVKDTRFIHLNEHASFEENTFNDYLLEIQNITNRKIPKNQMDEIEKHLNSNNYTYQSKDETKINRIQFNKVKTKIISEWEKNTNQKWPTYNSAIISKNGNVSRKIGAPYDAHHIIENSFGGEAEWWNIHPAKFPTEHQMQIHSKNSIAQQLFKR